MPTATKPRPRKPASAPTVTPEDVLAVINDVATNVLIERGPEMRVLAHGLLAGVNVHQLGPPGVAKSLGLRELGLRIAGAKFFAKTLHAQMPADAVIGGYDMPKFAETGAFERAWQHYAPGADIVNLGEVTRANGPTLDAILPMMNTEERMAEGNGGMFVTPIKFICTDSNFMPPADDPQFGAWVDRLTLMQYVEPVRADDSFKEMFRRHHDRRIAERTDSVQRVTITLEQLVAAQDAVMRITATAEFLDSFAKLRRQAREEGLGVSDRRWMELGRVARVSAWLAGREQLISEDLAAVESGLWRDIDQRKIAHKLCLEFHGRFEREADAKRTEAAKAIAKLEDVRKTVEDTPPSEDLPNDVLTKAIGASRGIDAVKERVDELLAEAAAEKRDASSLRDLTNELLAHQQWFANNSLPGALSSRKK